MNNINSSKKCSVIIPVYNCRRDLFERCISAFSGKENIFDLIIVNDGSDAETTAMLETYAKTYAHIRVFHRKNIGVSGARNFGIEQAMCDRITFCDADDDIDPVVLECLLEKADDTCDMLYTEYCKCRGRRTETVSLKDMKNGDDYFSQLLCHPNIYGSVWGKIYKRSILLENAIRFNESLTHAEDSVFLAEYLLHCHSLRYEPQAFYTYYVYEKSAAKISSDAVGKYLEAMDVIHTIVSEHRTDLSVKVGNFCIVNCLIMLVNYIYPKGTDTGSGDAALKIMLDDPMVRYALKTHDTSEMNITLKLAGIVLNTGNPVLCRMMARARNR